jgi:hypothetical protein
MSGKETIAEQNARVEKELEDGVAEYEETRGAEVSSALAHLIHATESETIDVVFGSGKDAYTIKVMASPPQRILESLTALNDKAPTRKDEIALCETLEYICVDPKITSDVWDSGQLSDEIPARIIFELMKHKIVKQDAMEEEIKSFREDKRGTKDTRGVRTPKKSTKRVKGADEK